MTAPTLRQYQTETLDRARREFADGRRRILLTAPTGSGKTIMAAALIDGAVAKNGQVLILAHRKELITQAARKLSDIGIDAGVILAGYPNRPMQPVQIASIQTLRARAIWTSKIDMPPATVVVIDEAHHARAETYRGILDHYPLAAILGLSATPCRGDGRGLGNIFDALVEAPGVAELTRLGHLVPAVCYAPSTPDLTGISSRNGDYVTTELAERVDTPKLVGDIVTEWHRLGEGRPTIVFATNVAHSVHLRDQFLRTGVLAEHLDGTTPAKERDDILERFGRGAVDVICNVQVLSEGYDQPIASCVVLGRPTKSLGLYRQMVGRGLRPSPETGKVDCLILDHAGCVFAHGTPSDEIAWTLSVDHRAENRTQAARLRRSGIGLVDCPECKAVRNPGDACLACGWKPTRRGKEIEIADGELARIDLDRVARKHIATSEEREQLLGELLYIARERGYKPGWASHKYERKFGSWPPSLEVPIIAPSSATWSWVKSQQIAYAMALKKREDT